MCFRLFLSEWSSFGLSSKANTVRRQRQRRKSSSDDSPQKFGEIFYFSAVVVCFLGNSWVAFSEKKFEDQFHIALCKLGKVFVLVSQQAG
jgi:hypothetical protein